MLAIICYQAEYFRFVFLKDYHIQAVQYLALQIGLVEIFLHCFYLLSFLDIL
ncbi:hypothetical protein MNBD_DELTA03-117 [hydrothermal vent metagenome]|uniref:Uncharacterized protein n=1 Tax=hydrothermal vent metagenome TaxID=652676 RepID=A0A3B0V313_9ZZZZ